MSTNRQRVRSVITGCWVWRITLKEKAMQPEIWSVVLTHPECAGIRELEELWRRVQSSQGGHSLELMQYHQGIIEGMGRCHSDHVVRVLASSMHDRVQCLIDYTRENVKAKAAQVADAHGQRPEPQLIRDLSGFVDYIQATYPNGFDVNYTASALETLGHRIAACLPPEGVDLEEGDANGE